MDDKKKTNETLIAFWVRTYLARAFPELSSHEKLTKQLAKREASPSPSLAPTDAQSGHENAHQTTENIHKFPDKPER